MPRGNRTGPDGMGPMTGRAAGFCAGNDEAGFSSAPGGGFGRRWNRGAGRGFGNGFGAGRGGFRQGSGYGRGLGPGFGPGGRVAGRGYASGLPTKTELAAGMKAEVEALEQRIAWLRGEIDAISAQDASEDA